MRKDVVERLLAHLIGRPERKHAGVIDQDVDMAVSQLDGLLRDRSGAHSIAKVGRDEIGFPARRPYFGNRPFTAFLIAAHDHDMNARLRQFVGCRAADSARCSGEPSSRRARSSRSFPIIPLIGSSCMQSTPAAVARLSRCEPFPIILRLNSCIKMRAAETSTGSRRLPPFCFALGPWRKSNHFSPITSRCRIRVSRNHVHPAENPDCARSGHRIPRPTFREVGETPLWAWDGILQSDSGKENY